MSQFQRLFLAFGAGGPGAAGALKSGFCGGVTSGIDCSEMIYLRIEYETIQYLIRISEGWMI